MCSTEYCQVKVCVLIVSVMTGARKVLNIITQEYVYQIFVNKHMEKGKKFYKRWPYFLLTTLSEMKLICVLK